MHLADAKLCIITGGCPLPRLVGKWTFAHLAEHYGDEAALNCHFAPRTEQRFTRFYGRGLGQGGVARKTDLRRTRWPRAPTRRSRTRRGASTSSPPCCGRRRRRGLRSVSGGQVSVPAQVCDPTSGNGLVRHAPLGAPLVEDLKALDFDWLAGALGRAASAASTPPRWAGMGGGSTPMHHDGVSNFFTQLVSRKRVLVFAPSEWPNVYPYPAAHPMASTDGRRGRPPRPSALARTD